MTATRRAALPAYAYLATAALAIAVYAAIPDGASLGTGLYAGIGAAATLAMVAGGHRAGRPARWVWYLFAAGIGLMTAGDTAFSVRALVGWSNPVPSWSDYCYFGAYPAIAAGLVLLVRTASAADLRRRTLDAAIVALALLAVLWTPYFSHFRAAAGHPFGERLTLALYPSFDLMLLALVVAYLLVRPWRLSEAFLPLAVLCLLAADLVWSIAPDSYVAGDWMDVTWLTSYSLWGVAALHPRARAPVEVAPARGASYRFAVLAAPLVLLPAGVGVEIAMGRGLSTGDAVIAAAVILLLLVRLALLVAAIDRSEERFRLVFAHARSGLLRIDARGVIHDANDALLSMLRASREDVVGRDLFAFTAGGRHDDLRAELAAVFSEGRYRAAERPIRTADGREVWVLASTTLIPGSEPMALVEIEDVTERRRADTELRASEDRFRRLFNEAAIGLATLDSELRITSVNDALVRIGQAPRDDVLGRPITDFVPESEIAAVAEDLAKVVELGHFGPREHRLRTLAGNEVWVLSSASMLPGRDGPEILVDVQDISELKRYQAELEHANLQKEELISVVSHDLRTPMTSIVGYLELLLEAETDEELASQRGEFIRVAVRNAGRLDRLVEDLLFVSRAHAGHAGLELEPVEVTEVARHAVDAVRPAADAKRIELALVGNGAVVFADSHRLSEAIENLLSNAVKFSPAGARVRVEIVDEDGDDVGVRVVDSGPGIAPEDVPHIFERFYRARQASDAPGDGLGLAIVEAIASAHHGSVSVETAPGEGAAFELRLPRRGPAAGLALRA